MRQDHERHGRACPILDTPLTHGWQSSGPIFGPDALNLPTPPPTIRVYFRLGKRATVISACRILDAYNHIGRRFEGPRIASWNV